MAFHRCLAPAVSAAALALASAAWAEPLCLADVQKFCSNTPAIGAQIQDCLKSHEKELSAGCKGHVDQVCKAAQQLTGICVWDIERFCSDVSPGGGKLVTCLQQNKDSLSPNCKEQFTTVARD